MVDKQRSFCFAITFLLEILLTGCSGVTPISQAVSSTVTYALEQPLNHLFFILSTTNQSLDKQSVWWFTDIIFLSAPDGKNIKIVGTYGSPGIIWVFDSYGQGQTMLVGVLPEPENNSSSRLEDRFGTLYLHETYYGSSKIISSRFDGSAYFLPAHDGIVFEEWNEQGSRHVIYKSDMNGDNRVILSNPIEDSYILLPTNDPDHVYIHIRIEPIPGRPEFPYRKIDIKTGEVMPLCKNLDDYRPAPNVEYIACGHVDQIFISDQKDNVILVRKWKGDVISMAWASDNINLLVAVKENGDTHFYIWNILTDQYREIYFGEIQGHKWSDYPEWSPDGEELLISSQDQVSYISTYYTLDIDTSKIAPVLDQFDYDKDMQFLHIISWAK